MPPVHYQPDHFPPDKRLEWHRLAPLIGPTAAAVARYDCLLGSVPHPLLLLATLRVQEAVFSSRIENIFADISTVLELDAGLEPANPYVRADAGEVLNYLAAERRARELLGKSPLSLRIVCEAHALLLSGEHGHGKSPGEFRRAQVWIGGPGSTPDTATFVPAQAAQVPDGMSAWERYIHAGAPDRLVQIAVQHAKFEAVHPFLDGNGRLGRMVIPLLMLEHGLIRLPVFGLSTRIAVRRGFYYDGLLGVSRSDDWTGWCLYFLDAVRAQAENGVATVEAILELRAETESLVAGLARPGNVATALDRIFARPVFPVSDFTAGEGIPPRTARRLLSRLQEHGVLEEIAPASGRRAAVMRFPGLLEVVEG